MSHQQKKAVDMSRNLMRGMVLALTTACGPVYQTVYHTSQGITVYCEDDNRCHPIEDTELLIDTFIGLTPDSVALRARLADGNTGLVFKQEIGLFECPVSRFNPAGECGGEYYFKNNNIAYNPCIARTSLAHEMAHLYLDEIEKREPDYSHGDQRFYAGACQEGCVGAACRNAAIVRKTKLALLPALCWADM